MDAIPALVMAVAILLYGVRIVAAFLLESWLDKWWRDRKRIREANQRRRMLKRLAGR